MADFVELVSLKLLDTFSISFGVKTNCLWQTAHRAEAEIDDDDTLPLASFNQVVYDLTTHWRRINKISLLVKYQKKWYNYSSVIIHNAVLTNIDTMMKAEMTSSLAFRTFTKAHYYGMCYEYSWIVKFW